MKKINAMRIQISPLRIYCGTFSLLLLVAIVPISLHAQSVSAQAGSPDNRFGPGDLVPLTVKLTNFGSSARVDVTVNYSVTGPTGNEVFQTSETVAVETTASYVKTIALPAGAAPGTYTAKTSVQYPGQFAPAVSEYQFTVERTYFGIYQSEFIWYVLGIIFVILFFLFLILAFIRYTRNARFTPHDYSMIDSGSRVYYELISDAIQQMRVHEGDRAIGLAQSIPGLVVDRNSGRVLKISADPSIVMATLVSEYHDRFGRNVNLSFNQNSDTRAIVR